MVGKSDDNKVGNSEFCSNWLAVSDEGTTDNLKGGIDEGTLVSNAKGNAVGKKEVNFGDKILLVTK